MRALRAHPQWCGRLLERRGHGQTHARIEASLEHDREDGFAAHIHPLDFEDLVAGARAFNRLVAAWAKQHPELSEFEIKTILHQRLTYGR